MQSCLLQTIVMYLAISEGGGAPPAPEARQRAAMLNPEQTFLIAELSIIRETQVVVKKSRGSSWLRKHDAWRMCLWLILEEMIEILTSTTRIVAAPLWCGKCFALGLASWVLFKLGAFALQA